jgi:hypothetical protein
MRKSTITLGIFAMAALCLLMASFQSVQAQRGAPPTDNDLCTGCEVVTGVALREREDTTGATTSANDPCISCCFFGVGQNSHSIWYCVDAAAGKIVRASTFGSDYDTVVAIFDTDGTGCPTGVFTPSPTSTCVNDPDVTELGCNDDAAGTLQSSVAVVSDGDRLYVEVAECTGTATGFGGVAVVQISVSDR